MRVLITGIAGFIGSHVAQALLQRGDDVVGIDNFNDYYDVDLKRARIKELVGEKATVVEADIADRDAVEKIFAEHQIDAVCHLAAQAGVRYSLENPYAYEEANLKGTLTIFESAHRAGVKKVVFASSSSVYGNNKKVPFSVDDNVDTPISLYAATKKASELMAHVYHHLYGMEMVGLRFFTVYGPWGRPDMALFKFTKAILAGNPIDVYNHGKMERDFSYITDIVSGVIASIDGSFGYEIFNLGNNNPVTLMHFIECIENALGKKAEKNLMPLQPGDVPATFADIDASKEKLGYEPKMGIQEGIKNFVDWYKEYH
jgi:UDP-glucuronate 4-epimerase